MKHGSRKIWMGLPFLYQIIAESMWRAMGWVCDQRPTAVIESLKQVGDVPDGNMPYILRE